MFLISLVRYHHSAVLHRQALIVHHLLTFLNVFSTLLLKPSFFQSFLHSHLFLAKAHLLELDHSLMAVAVLVSTADKAAHLAFGRTVIYAGLT